MSDPSLVPDDPSGSITFLFQQWRQGHQYSLTELMTRFRPRLLALARSTLSGRIQRMADAEDALQSAMISFWEKADRGDLKDDLNRDDLWNVMGLITVRKALRHQERERAQKRGGGKIVSGMPLHEASNAAPDAETELMVTELLELLDDDLRGYALLKLLGHKNQEIAEQLSCSERKVERKLQLIRAIWGEEMDRWNS